MCGAFALACGGRLNHTAAWHGGKILTCAALAMATFGVATVPALAVFGLGIRRLAGERPWVRRSLAAFVLVAGLWVVFQRHDTTPIMGHGDPATMQTTTPPDGACAVSEASPSRPEASAPRG